MTYAITRPVARPIGRFLNAQSGAYPRILREIRAGRKRTHWMWYVFPQLSALAKSEKALYYGIADRAEALAYLNDPVLRVRLYECTQGVLSHKRLMFSHPDNRKLQSSMTLFSQVVSDPTLPNAVLDKFYGGKPDQLTLDVLAGKTIELPRSRPQTAMGRVEWKQAPMWGDDAPDRAMRRAEVLAFVRGFGLPAVATRHLVDKWMEDQKRARDEGWDAHADEPWYGDPA